MLLNQRRHHDEKLVYHNWRVAHTQQWRPSTAKNKQIKKKILSNRRSNTIFKKENIIIYGLLCLLEKATYGRRVGDKLEW